MPTNSYTQQELDTDWQEILVDIKEQPFISPEEDPQCTPMNGGAVPTRLGIAHTTESKKQISDTMKGRAPWNKGLKNCQPNPMSGKTHTPETKRKMSKKQLGNKYCLGRKLSAETRKKISISQKKRLATFS